MFQRGSNHIICLHIIIKGNLGNLVFFPQTQRLKVLIVFLFSILHRFVLYQKVSLKYNPYTDWYCCDMMRASCKKVIISILPNKKPKVRSTNQMSMINCKLYGELATNIIGTTIFSSSTSSLQKPLTSWKVSQFLKQ